MSVLTLYINDGFLYISFTYLYIIKRIMFTLPFQNYCSIMVCGASGSGKTTFVKQCIENIESLFVSSKVLKIIYFYGIYQPLFEELKTKFNVEFKKGAPSLDDIEEHTSCNTHDDKTVLFVLDDLMDIVTKEEHLCKLFTEGCHHRKMCTMFLTQNLFACGKYSRTIARNTQYFVFTKTPRNTNIVENLARQVFNKKRRRIVSDAYEDLCANNNQNVLVVDLHPQSDDMFRIRSNVFEEAVVIYA